MAVKSQDVAAPDPTRGGRRLVFGASGYVGANLVDRLYAEGLQVRAAARRLSVLQAHDWPEVELHSADALDPATLGPALNGIDTAYYLVHSMANGKDFGRLEVAAAANFAAAAERLGVRRIVYLGGLVPPDAESEHIRSRRDTGDELRRGRVPVIEVRAGIIVGPGSAAFEVMRDLVFHLPVMVTPRWVRAKSPPIALDNLLDYLVRLPGILEAEGQVFDAAGPDYLTYEEMMGGLAEVAGRRRPFILPVPWLSPSLSAYWLKFVTSVPTNIARALIGGLRHDFTADPARLRELVPLDLQGFRDSVGAAFEAERRSSSVVRWVEGAYSMRKNRNDYAFYAMRASGEAVSRASPAALWKVVTAIGGKNRYYYMNMLWRIREIMDWLVGGPGLQLGRRHPQGLRVGDRIDSWEVIGLEPESRLTLAFGMRAPGSGVLEFEIAPLPNGRTRVTATAYWHPAGVRGVMYWFAFKPAHGVVFSGLTRAICERAEDAEARA